MQLDDKGDQEPVTVTGSFLLLATTLVIFAAKETVLIIPRLLFSYVNRLIMPPRGTPVFNDVADGYVSPNKPEGGGIPDFEGVSCQFYVESRQGGLDRSYTDSGLWFPTLILRLPWEDHEFWKTVWIVRVYDVDARHYDYRVVFRERMHQGFANRYRVLFLAQCLESGVPHAYEVLPYVPDPPPTDTVTTACCDTPTKTHLLLDFSSCACVGDKTDQDFIYNASGTNGAGWYSPTYTCSGKEMYWFMQCNETSWEMTLFCDGASDGTDEGVADSCEPFAWDGFLASLGSCCGLSPYFSVHE